MPLPHLSGMDEKMLWETFHFMPQHLDIFHLLVLLLSVVIKILDLQIVDGNGGGGGGEFFPPVRKGAGGRGVSPPPPPCRKYKLELHSI